MNSGVIRMVRISDIQNGNVIWETVPYCNIKEEEIGSYLLEKDDILFARTGGTVGKSFLVNETPYPAIYAGYLIRTRYSKMLSAKYMKYFMESDLYWEQLRDGTVATAQPNCNGKTLGRMILPIPPFEEQKRIVARVDVLLGIAARFEQYKIKLDELESELQPRLKKSILQYAIQGKLVPQNPGDEPASELLKLIEEEKSRLVKAGKIKRDKNASVIFKGEDNKYFEKIGNEIVCIDEELPFEIPESWTWVRMGTLVRLISGTSYHKGDVSQSGIRILRGGNIQDNELYIYDDDVFLPTHYQDEEKCIYTGDTIIVASTGSSNVIGKPAIIRRHIQSTQIGAFLRIVRPYSQIISTYVQLIFTSEYYRQHIRNKAKGTNINNIKTEYITEMLVPLPPLNEQKRIVEALDNVVASIMRN